MLTEKQAQDLMNKLISIKQQLVLNPSKELQLEYKKQEKLCIKNFKYIISMKTSFYKKFNNFEDLNQEGYIALLSAMNNYDPKKGSFFWWAHKYIDTRISRQANLHTIIRYPLHFSNKNIPHKESSIPEVVDNYNCPHKQLESHQSISCIRNAISNLDSNQKTVVSLRFGLNGDKPKSISNICHILNITRPNCIKMLKTAFTSITGDILE